MTDVAAGIILLLDIVRYTQEGGNDCVESRTFLHGAGMATAAGVGAGLAGSQHAAGQAAAKDELNSRR
jgi:hypothetical protein